MAFTKITAAGIGSTETVTIDGLSVINDASFNGNVSVGGTLTYEDVTNIDSVGLITARAGVVVGSGITLSKDGDGFFTGIVTATTFSGAFSGDGSALTGVANTDVIFTDKISLPDTSGFVGSINVGLSSDLQISHNGSKSIIRGATATNIDIKTAADFFVTHADTDGSNGENCIVVRGDGEVELYHDGSKKLETTSDGVTVSGEITGTQANILNSSAPHVRINNDTGDGSGTRVAFGKATGNNNFINGTVSGDTVLSVPGKFIHGVGTSAKVTVETAGNVNVASNLKVVGVCTATSFSGDGSNLTGVGGTSFIHAEQVNVSGVVTATGLVGNFAPRNMIINGAMQINQRQHGTETVNSSSSKYPCDRWVSRGEGGSKEFTIQKTSVASSGLGVRNALKVTSSQAASVSSSDIFNVRQMIEGFNTQRLNLGEAGCASMTLSFTAYSSVAGTHSGAIQNSAQNRSYPFTYTLAQNTWTDVKITIPPITSGSFNESNGVGLRVVFDMGSGDSFRGTAGQWNSAQDEGATGAVRILETNGATWYVTKVQLEEGTVATPFEKKLVDEELRNCQRYFEGVFMNDGTASFKSYPSFGGSSNFEYQMKVEKRSRPTFSLEGDAGFSGATPNAYESKSSVAFQVNGGTLFSLGDGTDDLCASFDAEL